MDAFNKKQYLNLETKRRNGEVVRTPVWFVAGDSELYFTTEPSSGKVKRMRRDPHVRVAPCKVNGELLGDWHKATARFLSAEDSDRINNLMTRKYGLMKSLFELFRSNRNSPSCFVALRLEE